MATADRSGISFACGLSRRQSSLEAAEEAAEEALRQLSATPHLAMLFLTADHADRAEQVAEWLVRRLKTECLIGCTGESIVAGATEVEGGPGMSLWIASLPDTTLLPVRLEFTRTPEGGSFIGWPDSLPDTWPRNAALIVFGDPFSFPPDLLLTRLNEQQPSTPVVGGMASAGQQPGQNRLVLGANAFSDGAVAVWIEGNVRMRTVVSQGCRPIGEHFVITRAERNVIHALGGAPAYERLEQVYVKLPTTEQRMLQQGLHVGRVVSEYRDNFEQGDFLVRNVVHVDREKGSIAIADFVRAGQTVKFHVRDAESADAELRRLLSAAGREGAAPKGGLLFTCNGRGTRLFREPHHDAQAIQQACGPIPLAGFFAAGELGPIAGKNFLHGFTASVALFESVEKE